MFQSFDMVCESRLSALLLHRAGQTLQEGWRSVDLGLLGKSVNTKILNVDSILLTSLLESM